MFEDWTHITDERVIGLLKEHRRPDGILTCAELEIDGKLCFKATHLLSMEEVKRVAEHYNKCARRTARRTLDFADRSGLAAFADQEKLSQAIDIASDQSSDEEQ